MNQLEFNFASDPFDIFLDNLKEGEVCYCGKKKNPRLWYCSLNCFLNNIKIRKTKLSAQEAEKLTKDWNDINNLIQEKERLNEW